MNVRRRLRQNVLPIVRGGADIFHLIAKEQGFFEAWNRYALFSGVTRPLRARVADHVQSSSRGQRPGELKMANTDGSSPAFKPDKSRQSLFGRTRVGRCGQPQSNDEHGCTDKTSRASQ
jgi:hypothetical protein